MDDSHQVAGGNLLDNRAELDMDDSHQVAEDNLLDVGNFLLVVVDNLLGNLVVVDNHLGNLVVLDMEHLVLDMLAV